MASTINIDNKKIPIIKYGITVQLEQETLTVYGKTEAEVIQRIRKILKSKYEESNTNTMVEKNKRLRSQTKW